VKKIREFVEKTKKSAEIRGAALGELGAQQGMSAALDHADRVDPGWGEAALRAIMKLCTEHEEFISDKIWDYIDPPGNGGDRRALGGVVRRAIALRYCEPLLDEKGRLICLPTAGATQHRKPTRVYKSLLWMPRYKER
jgi:hypothetical protein